MLPDPAQPSKTLAQRRRDLIFLDRSKTMRLLEDSEWGSKQLAATGRRLPPEMTHETVTDWALNAQWEMAIKAASRTEMPGIVRTVQGLEVVFSPREEYAASCEAFSDGSGLISISDALSTAVWRLATLNGHWKGRGSSGSWLGRRERVRNALVNPRVEEERPAIRAAVAALRYTYQHLRVWGTSAVVGPRHEEARLRDGLLAAAFIHAHEIGHFVLGHDIAPALHKTSSEREFEADEFAIRSLLSQYGRFDRVSVGAGAIVALCAIQTWESAALIRDVRTHPTIQKRWQAVAEILGPSHIRSEAHTFATRVISATAASSGSLRSEFWDSLREASDYEIVHGLPYLGMIEGFDRTESMSIEQRAEIVDKFAASSPLFVEGWRALVSEGWKAACDAWQLDSSALLDMDRSLSYLEVVNRIVSAPVWGETKDVFRRTCALISIHARLNDLKPSGAKFDS